jgi:hypothetical protein
MLAELQLGRFGRLGGLSSLSSEKGDKQLLQCSWCDWISGDLEGVSPAGQWRGDSDATGPRRDTLIGSPHSLCTSLVDRTARSLSVPGNSWVLTAGPGRQAVFRDSALRLGRYGRRRGDKVR